MANVNPTSTSSDRVDINVYDAAGRAVYRINALGYVTKNTYDANGNVIQVRAYAKAISIPATPTLANVGTAINIDAANDRIEYRAYDAENRLVYTANTQYFVTQTTYDALGRDARTTHVA